MPDNGSGTFIPTPAGFPEVPDTLIDANRYDAVILDIANALSNRVAKDGQTTVTSNIPMNGFKFTGVGAGSARTDTATLANIQDGTGVYIPTVSGTANAILLTVNPAIGAYAAGQLFRFQAAFTNTGAVTVAVSGLAAKALTMGGIGAVAPGQIQAGMLLEIVYNGTVFLLPGSVLAQFPIESYGTIGAGNDSTAIQAAINAAGIAGGGQVVAGAHEYLLGVGLTNIYNNVFLVGQGAGANRGGTDDSGSAATVFKWVGAVGGIMYDIGPASGAAHNVTGGGVRDIFFNGAVLAGTGVKLRSVRNCRFDMTIAETTVVGLNLTVEPTVTVDPGDTQGNVFGHVTIIQQAVTSGICVQLNGATTAVAPADTSLNWFGHLRLLHINGTALDLVRCDSNSFSMVSIYRPLVGATGTGVVFHAGTAPAYARSNAITFLTASHGGVTSQGTASGANPAIKNRIGFYNQENGEPLPVVEMGSSLDYQTYQGFLRVSRASTNAVMELQTSRNTAAASMGRYQWSGYTSTEVEAVYGYIDGRIVTNTNGAEDGEIRGLVKVAGTDTVQMITRSGIVIGASATGSHLGNGTINVSTGIYKDGSQITGRETITYSTSMTPDQRLGRSHITTVTDSVAFVFAKPTNSVDGDLIVIGFKNASGGALSATDPFATNYSMGGAWTQPANNKWRFITFLNQSSVFREISRSAADIDT